MHIAIITLFLGLVLLSGSIIVAHRHHHGNNNRLMELLTAGIVAKVLQKHEGDEGGHEFIPVPIHVPVHHHGHHSHHGHHDHHHGSGSHHHHVTEKIIPIPIPQHTTRIIHINADKPHSHGGGDSGSFDQGGGGGGGGSYGSNHGGSYDSSDPHDDSPHHHSGSSPSIQQIFFQDSGVYAPPVPQPTPMRYPAYNMAYRRPVVGMVPSGTHPAYMVRARYPYVAMRQRLPAVPAAYGAPMYAMPYRRVPTAASYMNPMVVRRPYPPPVMPPMW